MNSTCLFVLILLCSLGVPVLLTYEVSDWSEEVVVVDKPAEHPSHKRGTTLVVKACNKTLLVPASKVVWAETKVGDRIRIVHRKLWLFGTPASTVVKED